MLAVQAFGSLCRLTSTQITVLPCAFKSSKWIRKRRYKQKTSAVIPKGGPVAPDFQTVSYKPLPEHLDPEHWGKRGDLSRKSPTLWHVNWQMQKDARKRATATYYGPLRTRMDCLRFNGFLPLELKELADYEICTLPKDSNRIRTVNRCVMTSRPRGKKRRWRLSRMTLRHIMDHGMMSGIMRGKW